VAGSRASRESGQILELNISGTVSRRPGVTIHFTQNFTGYTMVSVSRTYDYV